jgi:hypothetical protein
VGTEVHDLSQVFTGGMYDVLADIFAFERNFAKTDPAFTLYSVAQYLCGLLLRAIKAAPASNATFTHVVNKMLILADSDGKPVQYRNFIRNQFTLRQVVVSPTPLTKNMAAETTLKAANEDHPSLAHDAIGGRRGCCGTMRSHEFNPLEEAFAEELKELKHAAAARK